MDAIKALFLICSSFLWGYLFGEARMHTKILKTIKSLSSSPEKEKQDKEKNTQFLADMSEMIANAIIKHIQSQQGSEEPANRELTPQEYQTTILPQMHMEELLRLLHVLKMRAKDPYFAPVAQEDADLRALVIQEIKNRNSN